MKKVKMPIMATIALFIGIITLVPMQSAAQDTTHRHQKGFRAQKVKERLDVIKKVKMLDELNLDENKTDAFLVKYNGFENQLNENYKQYRTATRTLRKCLNTNDNDAKISNDSLKKLVKNILDLQEQFNKISNEKMRAMADVLDDIQYAKFVCFENSFNKEFMGLLKDKKYAKNIKKNNKKKQKRNSN